MVTRTYLSQINQENDVIVVCCEYIKMNLMLEDYYKQRYDASLSNYNLIKIENLSGVTDSKVVESPHLIQQKWLVVVYTEKIKDIKKLLQGLTYSKNAVYLIICNTYSKYLTVNKEITWICPKDFTCLQIALNWVNKYSMKELIQLFINSIDNDALTYVINNLEHDTEVFYDFLFECRSLDKVSLSSVKRYRSINTNSWVLFMTIILGRVGTERRDKKFVKMYKNYITQEGFDRGFTILRNMFADLIFVKKLYQEGYISTVMPADMDMIKEKFPKESKYLTNRKLTRYLKIISGMTYIEILDLYMTVAQYNTNETDLLKALYCMAGRRNKVCKK